MITTDPNPNCAQVVKIKENNIVSENLKYINITKILIEEKAPVAPKIFYELYLSKHRNL